MAEINTNTKSRVTRLVSVLVIIALVGSLTVNVILIKTRRSASQTSAASLAANYPFLAPRIFTENKHDILIDFLPLRNALYQYAKQFNGNYSLYFEYLFTGSSIRLDASEDSGIIAASLIKLPIVMNLYRAVELGRLDLNTQVEIQADWLDSGFGDLWKKGAGTKITLQEAAKLALRDSDNTAVRVIQESVVPVMKDGEFALQALDVEHTVSSDNRTNIRAKDYSAILKCLYLACFVNEDHSQQILRQLTDTPFSDRIATGVPTTVPVAHKIGVFGDAAESDCGIFYVPNRPYLLCIMLVASQAEAQTHMSAISKMVYQYVSDTER